MSRKILGAQVQADFDIKHIVDTISICIQQQMTIDELAFSDLFYQPQFNQPYHLLNIVGMRALERR
ncbi:hypothetical protein G4V62_12645 [Bacillaceae bacterium SIJ1]|uniref:hypothetical protein n=1 Tax=Litoribacterium kuwaitense TaxID=1398745 RepID=UPI0013EBE56E|nr:hypothetical protein [Litoribacterium kuwaitense]NGP45761.1 hypothetical protein [Litoribacterium kuwaitense]